ncbi:MAG: undecaprenyl diphosphate synthase family protein [Oscillospiraceae bacterium]|nr:undecaprenyl diphosphate synthase family protein [Oscillospiraceae bacterium]
MIIKHLGIIPDGNRRWAKQHNITNIEAYYLFTDHICDIIFAVNEISVDMLTFYVISKENLKRNRQDISDVLQAVNDMLLQKMPSIVDKLQAKVHCIGIETIDNEEIKNTAKELEIITESNTGIIINLLIGYNPLDEINKAILNHGTVSIDTLAVPQCVDLLIRTAGGPTRLSNFLPLQCGYASIETLDDKFLDVSCDTIMSIVERYKGIEPKYGK